MACMKGPIHVALNAHLLSGEASYRSAGIHGYILNTLRCLSQVEEGLTYTVLMGQGQIPMPPQIGVHRSRVPTGSPLMRILWEQLAAPLALMRLNPDLFHGMAFSLPLMWHGPSVVTIYDMSFLRYPQRLGRGRRLYLQTATRISARRARRVIAISENGRTEISKLLAIPEAKIDVALPGVSADFRRIRGNDLQGFRRKHGLPERFILYVGTLEPRKNLETLVRAFAQLNTKEVKLVLVGAKGWQISPLFQLIEQLGLQTDVLMPGFAHTEELPYWYSSAEVFAYPSLYEGFGLPIVEAMACGAPVIASDTTSLPEAVGDAGLLVPPMEVGAWADTLASLLHDTDQRSDLSQRGLARARRFSWENTARQTIASYHKALRSES